MSSKPPAVKPIVSKEKRMRVNTWTIPVSFQHGSAGREERTLFSGCRTKIPRKGRDHQLHGWEKHLELEA